MALVPPCSQTDKSATFGLLDGTPPPAPRLPPPACGPEASIRSWRSDGRDPTSSRWPTAPGASCLWCRSMPMPVLIYFYAEGTGSASLAEGLAPGMTASRDTSRGHNRERASDIWWEEALMVLNTPGCTGQRRQGRPRSQPTKPGVAGRPGPLGQMAWDGSPAGPGPAPRLRKGQ